MILNKHIISPNPHVRQAACIWLLSLVRKLSTHSEVKSHLKEIQSAFVSVLSENDELSQDVASKGLGLVYELGNEQDQQELVSTLVETLMTGKRAKHEVSGETVVFQEEALAKPLMARASLLIRSSVLWQVILVSRIWCINL